MPRFAIAWRPATVLMAVLLVNTACAGGTAERGSSASTSMEHTGPRPTLAGELGAFARQWFARMRECGDDVRELMQDGYATACVGDAPFGYVNVFRAHMNVGFFYGPSLTIPRACWKELVSVCAM